MSDNETTPSSLLLQQKHFQRYQQQQDSNNATTTTTTSVVIDSILCYIINKRGLIDDDLLKQRIDKHFSPEEIDAAYSVLSQHCENSEDGVGNLCLLDDNHEELSKVDHILSLLDICQKNDYPLPRFAAVDINNMPSGGNNESGTGNVGLVLAQILQEMKLIKEFIYHRLGSASSEQQRPQSVNNDTTFGTTTNLHIGPLSSPTPSSGDDPSPIQQPTDRKFAGAGALIINRNSSRKRGNSRSVNSIEDAVAKIKAIKCTEDVICQEEEEEEEEELDPDSQSPDPDDCTTVNNNNNDNSLDNVDPINLHIGGRKQTTGGGGSGGQQQALPGCSTSLPSFVAATSLYPSQPSAAAALYGLPPTASAVLNPFFRPPFLDVFAPFAAAAATAQQQPSNMAAHFGAASATNETSPSPKQRKGSGSSYGVMVGGDSVASCRVPVTNHRLKSSYPSVQKLSKQSRNNNIYNNNNNNSHSAVPLSSLNGINSGGSGGGGGSSSSTSSSSSTTSTVKSEPLSDTNDTVSGANNLSSSRIIGDSSDSTYKPYVCQHANCNKRFANKFLLKKHEFIHTGERPHQCTYCFKRFNRKDNLLRHKKTHEANYSLVRRRSRHLFGVGKDSSGGGVVVNNNNASIGNKNNKNNNDDQQHRLSPSSNAHHQLISPRSVDSANSCTGGGGHLSPTDILVRTPPQSDVGSALKFLINNDKTANFFDPQQQQQQAHLAAAFNAFKASANLAAIWSHHAGGVSSSGDG